MKQHEAQMPTPRKPVDLQTKHMGRKEREAKADAEVTLGELKYVVTPAVKSNREAYRKWREIVGLYKAAEIKFVTSSDAGTMSRYCLVYSEYLDLVTRRRILSALELPEDLEEPEIIEPTVEELGVQRANKLWKVMEYLVRTDGILTLDKAINSKLKTLLDLENTLFLNPLAKIRSVPVQKNATPKDDAADAGFDV